MVFIDFTDYTFWVFCVLCGTIITNIILSWKDRQKQRKIDTARIFLDIWNISKDTKVATGLALLYGLKYDIKSNQYLPMLALFDFVATLLDGKTLDEQYVKSLFGSDIKKIRENESIKKTISSINKQHGIPFFPSINKLLERSKTWET